MNSQAGRSPNGSDDSARTGSTGSSGAGPTRGRLRLWILSLSAVVLVAAAGGLVACRVTDSGGSGPSKSPSPKALLTPAYAPQAPDGGTLRLLQSGASTGQNTLGQTMANYGITLQNTSKGHVAVAAEIFVTMLDAAGQPIADRLQSGTQGQTGSPESSRVKLLVEIAAPGQQVGLGRETYIPQGAAVAAVKVEVGSAQWYAKKDVRTPRFEAAHATTQYNSDRKTTTVGFTVTSEYPISIGYSAVAVFRDASGAVVGGAGPKRFPDNPPGTFQSKFVSEGPLPGNADVNRTEVYACPTWSAFNLGISS